MLMSKNVENHKTEFSNQLLLCWCFSLWYRPKRQQRESWLCCDAVLIERLTDDVLFTERTGAVLNEPAIDTATVKLVHTRQHADPLHSHRTTTLVYWPYSGTTRGSWYQNVSIMDFIGARNDGSGGKSSLPQLLTGRMPFLSPNQQCQSTEGQCA